MRQLKFARIGLKRGKEIRREDVEKTYRDDYSVSPYSLDAWGILMFEASLSIF